MITRFVIQGFVECYVVYRLLDSTDITNAIVFYVVFCQSSHPVITKELAKWS